MKLNIRTTPKNEFRQTENLTQEAFWNIYKPGCDEHFVLNQLRKSKSYVRGLDLLAMTDNQMVGHIISTKAKVIDSQNTTHTVLCIGPLSVSPEFQKKGIGSKLMEASVKKAKESGFAGMILFGNPDYYHRFGFKNAAIYRITTKEDQNFEAFMALETEENSLSGVSGRFYEDEAFSVDPAELAEFEKQFPFREKRITETQFKQD